MHLHTGSAERAYGSQRSVVKGIPVDAQQHRGDPVVEVRHGLFLRIGDWVGEVDGIGDGIGDWVGDGI
ncbi:hypothetical protein OHB54_29540 [Streptomyces sp. NBC_01007]|nr:hypothetical protein OHB54_29540 [Streptomyces sp. NBC_01007]